MKMTDLIIPNTEVAVAQDIDRVMGNGGGFLGRLQLLTANSEPVKKGQVRANTWAYLGSDDEMIELGQNVDVAVLAVRPLALDITNSPPVAVHDMAVVNGQPTGLFAEIMARSTNPTTKSKNMYGPQFLMYVPVIQKYAGYFMGSPTARNEANKVKVLLNNFATLGSKMIKSKDYEWAGPAISVCSVKHDLPPIPELQEEIRKFMDFPKAQPAVVVAPERER
jgi:hypothetical protein